MLDKTDNDSFKRDRKSKALINDQHSSYQQYLKTREDRLNQIQLNNEVQQLKTDVSEIKSLLQLLISKMG